MERRCWNTHNLDGEKPLKHDGKIKGYDDKITETPKMWRAKSAPEKTVYATL